LEQALDHLGKGHVILCPTDTIWGLSCDAGSESGIEKIIKIKNRTPDKNFIILVDSLDMLGKYVNSFPPFATDLIEYSGSPLTLIFPEAIKLSPKLIHPDGSIAIRLIKPTEEESKYCYELIRKFRKPIVSTSANLSGAPPPVTFDTISKEIKNEVDYIVPYFHSNLKPKKPSRIIKLYEDGTFKIIR